MKVSLKTKCPNNHILILIQDTNLQYIKMEYVLQIICKNEKAIATIPLFLLKITIIRSNSPFQTADKHYTLWKFFKECCAWTQNSFQEYICNILQ